MAKETGVETISEQLDSAISEEIEETDSPTVETGLEEKTEEEKGSSPESKGQSVPYTRFKEVNDSRKDIQEKYTELESQHREVSASLADLTKLVTNAKEDQDLLQEIKALSKDPNMLPHIEAIDRKLKGIEEELEEIDEKDPDKGLQRTQKILESEHEKLTGELAEQRSEMLTQRADVIADKWLEALPEEYTDGDRKIIARLWADQMETHWESIEENSDQLQEILTNTFQETIDDFGVPRGGLINPEDPDSYEVELENPPEVDPTEALMNIIQGKEYGKVTEGKAEVSDDDFAVDFAKVMKAGNAS